MIAMGGGINPDVFDTNPWVNDSYGRGISPDVFHTNPWVNDSYGRGISPDVFDTNPWVNIIVMGEELTLMLEQFYEVNLLFLFFFQSHCFLVIFFFHLNLFSILIIKLELIWFL